MRLMKNTFFIVTALSIVNIALAEELEEIQVTTHIDSLSTNPLSDTQKPNDIFINKQQLRRKASTLGNALSDELGVHSSQFGGGSSAPIIRGQEGVRLKVLQNGLDVVDMSQLSPDHAIAADTLLANNVEIVRGASTLLYATASQAGVVNVSDKRIPTERPEKGYAVDLGARYNTNSREKVENAALTFALGKHWVFRTEGLNRKADDYRVPRLQFNGEEVQQLPNSHNKSRVGTFGLSFVDERGYLGVSYSERRDRYGLVGHNHKFDSCYGHIIDPLNQYFVNRYYLHVYPHLMDDSDVREGAHFDCGSGHENSNEPSHSHPFGHDIAGGPFIDMKLKRYEIRGELNKPLPYLSKIRANFASSNYYHDEKEGNSEPINIFKNSAKNIRLEFVHEPIGNLYGVWGVQYQTQTSSAYAPRLTEPYKKLTHPENNIDRILNIINGESAGSSNRPKQSKPSLGGNIHTPSPDLDKLIGDLFIGDKETATPEPEQEEDGELSDKSPLDDLINGNAVRNNLAGNFDDILRNINRADTLGASTLPAESNNDQSNQENADDEDEYDDSYGEDNSESNRESQLNSKPSVGLDDILKNLPKNEQISPPPQSKPATWAERQTKDRHYALVENTTTQWSVFGMEQLVWQDFLFEFGVRHEKQKIQIDYDRTLLEQSKKVGISQQIQEPDLSPNKQRATSYSAGIYWNFKPEYLLSLIVSHNERLPTPMELYYHGKHLATNSFEYGNKDLHKEKSNNVEIGLNYQGEKWRYTLNAYYNQFSNRIFKQTLNKEGNLSMNRYAQAKADYYGVEGKIDYQFNEQIQLGIFGDYVRGVLKNLPPLRLKDSQKNTYEIPASPNAPRVPPARLGGNFQWQITEHLSVHARYTRAFAQNKVATLEAKTEGYNQLDMGMNYENQWFGGNYEVFIDVNNLLNAQIYSHSSYLPFVPQMGRNVVMGVNMSF